MQNGWMDGVGGGGWQFSNDGSAACHWKKRLLSFCPPNARNAGVTIIEAGGEYAHICCRGTSPRAPIWGMALRSVILAANGLNKVAARLVCLGARGGWEGYGGWDVRCVGPDWGVVGSVTRSGA